MRFPLALTGLSRYIGAVGSLGRRVTLILPAALIVWTARVPRPVGYLLGLGGVAYLVTGWIFGGRRFRAGGRSTQFHPAGSSGCRRCLHADHRLANADVRGQASWRSHQSAGGAYVIGNVQHRNRHRRNRRSCDAGGCLLCVYLHRGRARNTETTLTGFLHRENTPIQTSLLLFFLAFAVWFVFFAGLHALIAEAGTSIAA